MLHDIILYFTGNVDGNQNCMNDADESTEIRVCAAYQQNACFTSSSTHSGSNGDTLNQVYKGNDD